LKTTAESTQKSSKQSDIDNDTTSEAVTPKTWYFTACLHSESAVQDTLAAAFLENRPAPSLSHSSHASLGLMAIDAR
jgi:hypothetical protein